MNTRSGFATKLISVAASLALVVGLIPLPAFAEAADAQRLIIAAGELATTTDESGADDVTVLFESAAEGGKSSAAAGSGEFGIFKGPSGSDSNEVKLTLIDTRSEFDASLATTTVAPGGELAVSYSNAETGTNEYVSAMLCDGDGNALYYASLTPDNSGSGTWNMTLPDDLPNGSCTLMVFSEQQNGDKKSDYASPAKEYTLTVVDDPDAIEVSTWEELRYAALGISPSGPSGGLTNAKTIRLVGDIERPSDGSLIVVSRQVTIDLNGHKLDRKQPHVAQNDGEGHVIEVRNSVRLTIKDGSSRKTGTITGGWAERGGGIYVCAKGTLNFDGGVLADNQAHSDGGGIYVEKGGTFNLNGGIMSGNATEGKGGGVCVAGTMNMSGGSIAENTAEGDGGGIHVEEGGALYFNGGTISGNTAEGDGGGISVYGTLSAQDIKEDMFGPVGEQGSGGTIADNTAQETGGGVFVEDSGTIFLYCANVSDNRAKDGGGGVNVHFDENARNGIAFCTITNNRSSEYGGGIRMTQDGGTLAVWGTAIEGNWAIDAGGVYAREGKVAMSGGTISGNTASGDGGGVKVHGGAEFAATDVVIQGNKATTGKGGGIKNDGTATLSSCSITENTACSYGGGIYVDDATTNIQGALKVIDNSSDFGRNMYLCEGDTLTCTGSLTDAQIGVDLAKGTGTLTEYYGSNNNAMGLVARMRFSVAKGYDVGIEVIDDVKEVVITSEWEWLERHIEEEMDSDDSYTLDRDYAAAPSDGRIDIDGNKSITINLNGHTLNRNCSSKTDGGHVFQVHGGSMLTIEDSSAEKTGTITGGWSGYGGGIYVNGGGILKLLGGTITGNKAADDGGGVYLAKGAELRLFGGAIRGNTAVKHGGGVYASKDEDTAVRVRGTPVVQGNHAPNGNNVYLSTGVKLDTFVGAALEDGAQIGVALEDDWGEFTSWYWYYNRDDDVVRDPNLFFTSDEDFEVALEGGEAVLHRDTFGKTDDADPFIDWNDQMKPDTDALTSRNWMAGISGERYLNEINLPGAHDAGMKNVQTLKTGVNDHTSELGNHLFGMGYKIGAAKAKTQTEYIDEQLKDGARIFDIRLTQYKKVLTTVQLGVQWYDWESTPRNSVKENLWVCHGESYLTGCYLACDREDELLSFAKVLEWVEDFLEKHPTETVILHIRPQTTYDDKDKEYEEVYKRTKITLKELAADKINESTGESFLYMEPGSNKWYDPYTRMPQLKDCRGKIVLFFEYGGNVDTCGGFTYSKGALFDGAYTYTDPTKHGETASDHIDSISDSYDDMNGDGSVTLPDKADATRDFLWHWELNCTGEDDGWDYFWDSIGRTANPVDLADEVNPALVGKDKLFGSQDAGQYIGWVKMDAFEAKYAEAIWRTNFFDSLQYCTVTVESGVEGDPRFPAQTFRLLKGTTISVPGRIYIKEHPQGASFDGWMASDSDVLLEEGNKYTVDDDVTFTAQWAKSGYTVTYKVVNGTWADGATEDKTETVASGDSPTSVPTGMVAADGYKGGAWDTDPSAATITADAEFTYTFEEIPPYTLRFDANVPANASTTCVGAMEDQGFAGGEKKALSENGYSLPGYDFSGWNTKADGTGTLFVDKAEVQGLSEDGGTVVLYAQWSAKPYAIWYWSDAEGSRKHVQTAYFDRPGKLDVYSDEAFGWDSGAKTLHRWSGTGFGSFLEDGDDFCNLCGAPDANGNVADATIVADWVNNGQIVVTVTKDGAPQEGLKDYFALVQNGATFKVKISYSDGKYVFDPSQATAPGGQTARLPEGEYELRFSAPGYPAASVDITYGNAYAASAVFDYYTVSLTKDPVYADFNEVKISGGEPVAGAFNTVVALDGDTLGIKTTVSEGYRFEGYIAVGVMPIWEDGDSSKAEQTIEVQGKADIMAFVAPVEYSVTVEGGATDKATAKLGETVTIKADAPEPGKAFVQWANVDGVNYDNASSTLTSFTMPAKDVTVTAVYAPIVIGGLNEQGYQYIGEPIAPDVAVSLDGVDVVLTDEDYEVSFEDNVNVGDAKVVVTMKSPSAGSAVSAFKITPRPATIVVESATKVQGEDDPAFTGAIEGLIAEGDLGEVHYVRTNDDEAPGTYEGVLTATYADNANYDVSVTKGDFTIKALLTVTWLDGDGSVLQTKTYGEGDEPPAYDGKEPTKVATEQYTYKFISWDDGIVDGTTTTYRPLFSETVNEYTVRFVNDDGTELQSGKVAYGEMPKYEGKTPEKAATAQYTYAFKGWSPEIVAVTGNATYKATYTETAKKKGTLTFDCGGGTIDGKASLTIEANVGDTITIPKAPVRDGYTFKYWKGSEYYPGDKYTVEGDHKFTATWEKKSDDNGGGTKGTSTPSSGAKGSSPSTGDTSGGTVAAVGITAACALCLAVFALLQRRRRPSEHSDRHIRR